MSKTNPTRSERREIERIKMMDYPQQDDNELEDMWDTYSVVATLLVIVFPIVIIIIARIIAYFLGL